MHLRTLGACDFRIGGTTIGVEQPTIFACLLLLTLSYPVRLTRTGLAADLWPLATPPQRNHRLRTLLYRCRRLGASLVADETFVGLSEAPVVDFREYSTAARSVADARARAARVRPVLPGIEAMRATCIADRMDEVRTLIVATMTQWSSRAMLLARSAGEWDLVEQLARAARIVDPLSATAWLNLAEAQSLTGRRPQALQTLDEYLAFVAEQGDAPLASARDLRQRIVAESARMFEAVPHAAMRRIWPALARTQRGRGGALLVWGPAGMGKTRLLDETERAAVASRSRVARISVRPVHCLQPTGLVSDLVARLIDSPGAMGCDPDAYQRLRKLSASNESLDDRLFQDVTELLAAITDESPLVVAIDDAHVLDADSWPFWRAIIRWSTDRHVLWIFTVRAVHESELAFLPDRTLLPRVALIALDRAQANALSENTFDATGGNPLLLRAAADPFDAELGALADAAIDDTLSRLTNEARAVLGTVVMLESVRVRDLRHTLPRTTLVELLQAGIVHEADGVIRVHARWAEALLANYPRSSPPMSAAMIAF